jgi:hypothetical protein
MTPRPTAEALSAAEAEESRRFFPRALLVVIQSAAKNPGSFFPSPCEGEDQR